MDKCKCKCDTGKVVLIFEFYIYKVYEIQMDLIYVDGCGEVENENVKNCILISNIYFVFFVFFGGGGEGASLVCCQR